MAMTITEKILALKAGKDKVKAGEIVTVDVDWLLSNDATTHISIDIFKNRLKESRLAKLESLVFIIDHNIPAESEATAAVHNKMRNFAAEHGIKLHDGEGVCHQIMLEKYVNPAQVVIGADSHTCSMGAVGAFGSGVGSTDLVGAAATGQIWLMVPDTIRINLKGSFRKGVYARDLILKIIGDLGSGGATYKTIEFSGEAMSGLTMDDRIVLCNMVVEAGAKNGIVEPDEVTAAYLESRGRAVENSHFLKSDSNCTYSAEYSYNLEEIEPALTAPHFVDNYGTTEEGANLALPITQGFIGSCNNGRIEQLRVAAAILKGKRIKPEVKLLISPASQEIYLQAIEEGLVEIFIDSGAMILNPNCSVCWGACQGVIGKGERMLSTGTRNFKGRAGSPEAEVYLASAATVAASCLEGKIVSPLSYL